MKGLVALAFFLVLTRPQAPSPDPLTTRVQRLR